MSSLVKIDEILEVTNLFQSKVFGLLTACVLDGWVHFKNPDYITKLKCEVGSKLEWSTQEDKDFIVFETSIQTYHLYPVTYTNVNILELEKKG